jgi:small subunit ribosomal protein S19e
MVSIYVVDPRQLIEEVAKEFAKMPEMAPPEWASYVKTGVHNMRPPVEENWWYIRAAAILRSIYKLGPIGVSKLRTKYGGRKNRGVAPDKTFRGSGNIIRKILQQLELIGFVKQGEVGVHKGRIMTPKGKSFVDKLAAKLTKGTFKKKTEVKEVKKEAVVKEEKAKVEEKVETKAPVKEEKVKPEVKKADEPKPVAPVEEKKSEPVKKEEPKVEEKAEVKQEESVKDEKTKEGEE